MSKTSERAAGPKRRGRPRKTEEQKKRPAKGFRPSHQLAARLDQASAISGRTVSEEIVARLERTFLEDDEFGGPEYRRLALILVSAIHEVEILSNQRWYATGETTDNAAAFIISFLDNFGRTFGEGAGTTVKMDPKERVKELRAKAERLRSEGTAAKEG